MFKKSKNKGFSLVELIVVIAILVVFAAILVPSLLQYTENSRAQKDESAMDEVVNAVQLALADEKCFDEALKYSCTNNYLTYSDSSGNYGQQINDGEFWAPDGSGRATTITFNPEYGPNNQIIYDLSKGIVNDMTYGNGSVGQDRIMQGAQITDNQCYLSKLPQVYNTVRQTVGTDIITTSQTYRNSSFTIFIKFNQKDSTTVADVSGSFNGTNLYEGANAASGSGTSEYDSNGDAITTITTPSSSAPNYTASSLSGTGSFGGSSNINNNIADYQQPTYIENIQKENKCYYYSTFKKAVDDVNNNTMGQNGDSEKDEAIAFIYTENGTNFVVLLKDHTVAESIVTTKNMTIVLGGHSLTGHNMKVICNNAPSTLTLDARIEGSAVNASSDDSTISGIGVYNYGHMVLRGGTYTVSSTTLTNGLVAIAANRNCLSTDIKGATVIAAGFANRIYGIQAGDNTTIDNCNINVYNKKPAASVATTESKTLASGIFCPTEGNSTITNTTIDVKSGESRYIHTDGSNYWSGAIGIDVGTSATTEIRNCNIKSSALGVRPQSGSASVYNCKIYSGRVSLCNIEGQMYAEQCDLYIDPSLMVDNKTTNTSELLSTSGNSETIVHNCVFNKTSNFPDIEAIGTSIIKISQSKLSGTATINNTSKLYLGARNSTTSIVANGTNIISTNETYKK